MRRFSRLGIFGLLISSVCAWAGDGLLTGDTYITSANPSANFGTAATMFAGSGATPLFQFGLSTLGSSVQKATLLVYVDRVSTAGNISFALLSGTFTETTVNFTTGNPLIGSSFAGPMALSAASVGTYIAIDVTTQVQAALAGSGNIGFAIVPDATVLAQFDTKENTATSHPPQLSVVAGSVLTSSNFLPGDTTGTIFVSRNAGSNPGSNFFLQSGSPALGATDVTGGDIFLAGGPGTGLGAGGNLHLQTAGANDLSGTTDNLVVDREIIVARGKQMTLSAPGFTSLMSIHLVGTHTAGGRIFYMIRATDGGSQIATEEGVIQYLATANSITCTVQTTDKLHLGTVNSGCTPGFFNPGSQPGVSIFDNVTFSSSAPIVVHEVYFRVENDSGSSIRLEP
jgi:hypothetical protein